MDANDGYYVVVYKGSDRLLSVYTDVDEEQLVLTEMDPSWQGKRFYAKVKALPLGIESRSYMCNMHIKLSNFMCI